MCVNVCLNIVRGNCLNFNGNLLGHISEFAHGSLIFTNQKMVKETKKMREEKSSNGLSSEEDSSAFNPSILAHAVN